MLAYQNLNNLSQLLSTATFRKLILEGDESFFLKKVNKHVSILNITEKSTNRDVIRNLYSIMNENYRFEYLYKNNLFNKLVEQKKLSETIVLNELRVGSSIADTVFVNGEPVLYEIKTELDNPQKLFSQLKDYEKAFAKIYIVTHESIYYKYYQAIKASKVGLMYVSTDNNLIVKKQVEDNFENLDHQILFKLLRKGEFTSLIENYFGNIPAVPNTIFFRTCLEMVKQIPIQQFYTLVFSELKKRKKLKNDFLQSNKTPKELRYICYTLDFDKNNYQSLYRFLRSPFKS